MHPNILQGIQIMMFLPLLPLRSKYLPQHPVPKHPQSMLFP